MNFKIRLLINATCLGCLIFSFAIFKKHNETNSLKKKDNTNWERLGPGGGGSTFTPTFSYSTPDHFLVKCDMTGSYLTTDGGNSYSQINFANGASSYAYDPKDSNTIYIGSTFLNRSTDGGKTWQRIFPKENDIKQTQYLGDEATFKIKTFDSSSYDNRYPEISAIRIDPSLRGSLYFSMGTCFFYSSDSGITCKKKLLDQDIRYLYTNRNSDKNEVCIFTSNSIYFFNKSTKTFSRKNIPKEMAPAFSYTAGTIKNSDKTIFYALHYDSKKMNHGEFGHTEVWKSEDQGVTWAKIADPLITNSESGIQPGYSTICCSEFDAANAYLVCNRYQEKKDDKILYWYGALKTANSGKTWEWVLKGGGGSGQYGISDGVGFANLKDAWVEKAFGGEYIRMIDVGVYPSDGNIAILTDWYRTMKTMDGGKTWNQIYTIQNTDGTVSSNGMDVTTCYGVHFDPFDSNHLAVSYTDIGYFHSFNGGKSWERSVKGVPKEWLNTCYWVLFDPDIKGKVWSVWSSMHDIPRGKMTRDATWKKNARGGICVSDNGGKSWKPINEGMGFDSPTTSIILDSKSPPGSRTLYASVYNKGVFKSIDDGKTWTLKNSGIGDNTCAFELTMAGNGNLFLTVSPTPMHKDHKKGRGFYSGAVYKSVDGAETWIKLNVINTLLFPNGIGIDPKNPDRIYLACWSDIELSDLLGGERAASTGGNKTLNMPGGIFLSEDGGSTWKSIFDKRQYVYDVTVDPIYPGRIYCNTFTSAAYRSDDYGKTWKKIKGYDFHWGHRVIIDPNNPEKIYLTTFGSSVWYGSPDVW